MRAARRAWRWVISSWRLVALVDALAIAQQFADAENGGEGIVELVSDAGEHLAHGGELFRLDELLFEALEFGDVAAGNDHAFDLAVFIEERAEIAAKAAPFALLCGAPGLRWRQSCGVPASMSSKRARRAARSSGWVRSPNSMPMVSRVFIAENFLEPGADKGVVLVGIDDEDKVGETVDKAASEFLLFVEALFHVAALGDIHDGALIADHVAGGVANGGGGVQANEGLAILAAQSDFVALGRGLAIDFS